MSILRKALIERMFNSETLSHIGIDGRSSEILFDFMINDATIRSLSEEHDISVTRVRQIIEKAIWSIRIYFNGPREPVGKYGCDKNEVEKLRHDFDKVRGLLKEAMTYTGNYDHYDTPIEKLDLTVRAYNCLKSAGYNVVRDFKDGDGVDFLKMRNFGRKSLNELNKVLKPYDIHL